MGWRWWGCNALPMGHLHQPAMWNIILAGRKAGEFCSQNRSYNSASGFIQSFSNACPILLHRTPQVDYIISMLKKKNRPHLLCSTLIWYHDTAYAETPNNSRLTSIWMWFIPQSPFYPIISQKDRSPSFVVYFHPPSIKHSRNVPVECGYASSHPFLGSLFLGFPVAVGISNFNIFGSRTRVRAKLEVQFLTSYARDA